MTTTDSSQRVSETGHMRRLESSEELKARYKTSLCQLRDIFPDWSEEDLVAALSDLKGDLEMVIARISEGHMEPWAKTGEKPVKKLTVSATPIARKGHRKHNNAERQLHPRNQPQNVLPADRVKPCKDADVEKVFVPEIISKVELSETVHETVNASSQPPKSTISVKRYTSIRSTNAKGKPSLASVGTLPCVAEPASEEHMYQAQEDIKAAKAVDVLLPHEEKLSKFVSSIVEEVDVKSSPVIPIVQMPKTLSSRISSSAASQQPVVVLPLKATVRPGLSVNFGVSNTSPQSDQAQSSRSLENVFTFTKQPIASEVTSPRYTSTSVEATLLSSPRADLSDSGASKRSQPIQRPVPSSRETYNTPPPGLSSDVGASDSHMAHGVYPKSSGPANRYPHYPVAGSHFSHEEIADANTSGLPHYYVQGSRAQYQPQAAPPASNFSRSMDFSKSGENGRPGHSFNTTPWNTYANPQGPPHGSYYPNTHYSQHVYSEQASYHPQQQYSLPPNRYTNQPSNAPYGASHAYNAGFYSGVNDQGFAGQHSQRSANSQQSRQVFPNTFSQPKNL